MKNHFLLILLTFLCVGLFGQTQPIEKVEIEPDPIMMDAYDFATGRMNDVKWMAKVNFGNGTRVGIEYKLTKALSINLESSFFQTSIFEGTSAGLRYYLGHKDKIEAREIGNNFNGKYLEFGSSINSFPSFNFYQNAFLGFGMQSRFLKYGLVDTYVRLQFFGGERTLRLSTGFDLGFAFSKDYDLVEMEENRCAVVRCYDEQFYMLKIPLSRLLSLSVAKSGVELEVSPAFELEHRLSPVSLTVNHELRSSYNLSQSKVDTIGSSDYLEASYRMNIRWYVGKKKRIIKGKTSNNLSGYYIGPIAEFGIASGSNEMYRVIGSQFYSLGFQTGYQTRLLKNLFFDISFGFMGREYYDTSYSKAKELLQIKRNSLPIDTGFEIYEFLPLWRIIVGYAF